eukprot:CAMPEP_0117557196 /NCGR_PEP_ID=MMETSP0784-20121206/52201_1 /TAXON_ID=39447 /ORGANISM="" /LENGTH=55 /DNA_ID=CAMNT_0005354497 /DNA_START=368 /DNA_END=536 /DNA_ORIENTATION=+
MTELSLECYQREEAHAQRRGANDSNQAAVAWVGTANGGVALLRLQTAELQKEIRD